MRRKKYSAADLDLPVIQSSEKFDGISIQTFLEESRKPLLVVSCGLGRNSVAMVILFYKLGIRPDLILFADTGNEKPKTYAYIKILKSWLKLVGFPELTIVRAMRPRDASLESHCLRLGIFPSLAYGRHGCSVQWKIEAQNNFLKTWLPAIEATKRGERIVRAIGFEAGEEYRARRAGAGKLTSKTSKIKTVETGCKHRSSFAVSPDDGYISYFPLIECGIDFDGCLDLIGGEGLSLPVKSACFFCPASKIEEIINISVEDPHLFFRSLVMERVVCRNKIKPPGRVRGLDFGKPWMELECAAPYLERLDEVIEIFGLNRTAWDGIPDPKNEQWKPKAYRVEVFREAFSTAENLALFMKHKLNFEPFLKKINEMEIMYQSRLQAQLPLAM